MHPSPTRHHRMTTFAAERRGASPNVREWFELACLMTRHARATNKTMLQQSMNTTSSFAHLSDEQVLATVRQCAQCERDATARFIASLAELDARRLYLARGCSSLFTYCAQVLHLSEHAAYGRIEAARAARRFPVILELLNDASINLTTIGLLAHHLTQENHQAVLEAARHKTKREIELLVASLHPRPDVPSSVRKLPVASRPPHVSDSVAIVPSGAQNSIVDATPMPRAVVTPLAPERFRVQFTVSRDTYDKLRRAQDLLRHRIPNGDPAAVFDRALTLLIAETERAALAATDRPRARHPTSKHSRHVPAAVKREVWKRDEGRCAFIGAEGRCSERGFLEIHHVVPYAEGGEMTIENLQLRCRAHNAYESERWFGPLILREIIDVEYGD